ncbi:MAG: hypothetical protein ACOC80_08350 [Petrotogales bacterium]
MVWIRTEAVIPATSNMAINIIKEPIPTAAFSSVVSIALLKIILSPLLPHALISELEKDY